MESGKLLYLKLFSDFFFKSFTSQNLPQKTEKQQKNKLVKFQTAKTDSSV